MTKKKVEPVAKKVIKESVAKKAIAKKPMTKKKVEPVVKKDPVAKKKVVKEPKAQEIIPFFFHFEDKAKAATGDPMKAYLSNWSKSKFVDTFDNTFYAVEQMMMYEKATLFMDHEMASKILEAVTKDDLKLPPKEWNKKMAAVKKMGREVSNFDPKLWEANREIIVVNALQLKFEQNPKMLEMLKSTGDSILVEAAPRDLVWGVGVGMDKAKDPKNWRGLNLLGKCLMEVRAFFLENDPQ